MPNLLNSKNIDLFSKLLTACEILCNYQASYVTCLVNCKQVEALVFIVM